MTTLIDLNARCSHRSQAASIYSTVVNEEPISKDRWRRRQKRWMVHLLNLDSSLNGIPLCTHNVNTHSYLSRHKFQVKTRILFKSTIRRSLAHTLSIFHICNMSTNFWWWIQKTQKLVNWDFTCNGTTFDNMSALHRHFVDFFGWWKQYGNCPSEDNLSIRRASLFILP